MHSFYSTLPPLSRTNIIGVHARVVGDLRATKDATAGKGLPEPFCYLLDSGSIAFGSFASDFSDIVLTRRQVLRALHEREVLAPLCNPYRAAALTESKSICSRH